MSLLATGGDTTVLTALISAVGLIIVSIIGVWTAKVTYGAKKEANVAKEEARSSSEDALSAAQMARDYAEALGAKDALITSLKTRVEFLEAENDRFLKRLDDFESKEVEHRAQQQAAALIERNYAEEIDQLREEIDALKEGR